LRPGDCIVAPVERKRRPPDVGDERDLLPGPEVLDADLQVLPERPAGETVESRMTMTKRTSPPAAALSSAGSSTSR